MPHADASYVPESASIDKAAFYRHLSASLDALLTEGTNWISALSNCSSLLYFSYLSSSLYGPDCVNWVGCYMLPSYFPSGASKADVLLLGPFCGRPACQFLKLSSGNGTVGVCATAYNQGESIVVGNVHVRANHIACDANTKSEIVVPLYIGGRLAGVLDLDSEKIANFDEEDRKGLETIVAILNKRVLAPAAASGPHFKALNITAAATNPDEEFSLRFFADWGRSDAHLLAQYFAEDGQYINVPRPSATGRKDIETMIAGFFALYRIEIVTDRMISKDGWIWTQRRDYMVTRDGKEGMVPVVGIMHVVDGKIASWEEYFDEKTFERASGIQL